MTTANDHPQPVVALSVAPPVASADDTDRICEQCGYTLLGLVDHRCPECGHPFDPSADPLPAIPWLARRKIGTFTAYRRTVAMACLRPAMLAAQVRRSPLLTIADAEEFRRLVLLQVVLSAMLIGAVGCVSVAVTFRSGFWEWTPLTLGWVFVAFAIAQTFVTFASTPLRPTPGADVVRHRLLYEYSHPALAVTPALAALWGLNWITVTNAGIVPPELMILLTAAPLLVLGAWWYVVILRLLPRGSNRPGRAGVDIAIALPWRWLIWAVISVLVGSAVAMIILPLAAMAG
jgi:hypothetical protein